VQVVDEIFDEAAARKMGIDTLGQVRQPAVFPGFLLCLSMCGGCAEGCICIKLPTPGCTACMRAYWPACSKMGATHWDRWVDSCLYLPVGVVVHTTPTVLVPSCVNPVMWNMSCSSVAGLRPQTDHHQCCLVHNCLHPPYTCKCVETSTTEGMVRLLQC
jgi:hypothetical protein